jgi:hypothetical protein
MYVLSFDPAHKSLGVCFMYISDNYKRTDDLYEAFMQHGSMDRLVNELEDRCRREVLHVDVVDLLPNVKVADVDQCEVTKRLSAYLDSLYAAHILASLSNTGLTTQLGPTNAQLVVLVEDQTKNKKSTQIQHQILMYFVDKASSIHLVNPRHKNTLFIEGDEKSFIAHYVNTYKNKYDANKAHSRYLFCKLVDPTAYKHVKKSLLKDCADAHNQVISWHLYHL